MYRKIILCIGKCIKYKAAQMLVIRSFRNEIAFNNAC